MTLPMKHTPDLDPREEAEKLGKALARLAGEYPTDPDDADLVALTLDASASVPSVPGQVQWPTILTVQLQPGQIQWLTQLVERELATARNCHADGDGKCGHCHGTGTAHPSAPVTHLLGWFPGELLSDSPSEDGWELHEADGWHESVAGRTRLGGTQDDDPIQLEQQVADALGSATEIVEFRRTTYVIEGVNDPDGPYYRPGPWTFPMFEIRTRPAELQDLSGAQEAPADDGSRP